jgi:hypothetical protein
MGAIRTEDVDPVTLTTTREPSAAKADQMDRSVGDQALRDALWIIGGAAAIIIALAYSLRRYNV